MQRSALTGDVTASAGSNATTIANDAVTNAKLADMAANTVKTRSASTSGDPGDLAVAASRLVGRGSSGDVAALTVTSPLEFGAATVQLNASAADKYLYSTAADTWTEGAITAAGRAILDDADAAAQRVTLNVLTIPTITTASITTSNYSGAVNNHYRLDLYGLTADRNFTLPTATVGDELSIYVKTGHNAYELIILGAATVTINGGGVATEWSRLFITGEMVRFRATSTTNWDVIEDKRIPCKMVMTRTGSNANTTHSAATDIKADWNNLDIDVGNMGDLTNDRANIRRAGYYICGGGYAPAAGITDAYYINVLVYKNGTGGTRVLSSAVRQSTTIAAPGSSVCSTHLSYKPHLCAVGDYLEYYFKTESADRGLLRTDYTGGGYEVLQGVTFFAVTEILPT